MKKESSRKDPFDVQGVVKRLDVLLGVILTLPTSADKQMTTLKRVELLSSAGTDNERELKRPLLRNIEIARILGISPDHVGVLMNKLRQKAKQPRKAK